MTEPRTAAGRALLADPGMVSAAIHPHPEYITSCWLCDRILAIEAEAAALDVDYDAMRIAREWPTPNHMRRAADALDIFTPAKYGDVLRWFADRCDEHVWHMGDPQARERLEQARSFLAAHGAGEERE